MVGEWPYLVFACGLRPCGFLLTTCTLLGPCMLSSAVHLGALFSHGGPSISWCAGVSGPMLLSYFIAVHVEAGVGHDLFAVVFFSNFF